jgi:hypothetical protein
MNPWLAILFAIGLVVISVVITAVTHYNVVLIMILGTSIWAADDSKKIGLKKYKSGISYGPVVLFIAVAMFWIVGFPWYLAMKHKIKNGTAVLKEEIAVEKE